MAGICVYTSWLDPLPFFSFCAETRTVVCRKFCPPCSVHPLLLPDAGFRLVCPGNPPLKKGLVRVAPTLLFRHLLWQWSPLSSMLARGCLLSKKIQKLSKLIGCFSIPPCIPPFLWPSIRHSVFVDTASVAHRAVATGVIWSGERATVTKGALARWRPRSINLSSRK